MELKQKIVVVGLGSIGRRHTRLLLERSDLNVEVCETSDNAMSIASAELGDVTRYVSFQHSLDSKPDIIWLASPTQFHTEQSVAALENGCHVFCEKPMSDTFENALKIKNAVDKSGRIFNVGFMLHFLPAMRRLRELITDGTLGNILHIHARVGTYITLVNSLSRYQADRQGSLFLDYAHQPDIFYWLTGRKPISVAVTGFQAGELEFSSDPNVAVIVSEYDGKMLSTLHLNYVQMPQQHSYEIVGDKAWATLDLETGQVQIGDRETQSVTTEQYVYERDDLYRIQIAAFLDAVAGTAEPETSAEDGLVSTLICEACIESYQNNGKKILLPLA